MADLKTALKDKPYKPPERTDVTLMSLAGGFAKMGLCSFGGGLTAWAEHVAVREKKWLSEDEFLHALAICQILPGPNMIKLAAYIGSHFRGFLGVVAAVGGLLAFPIIIVMTLGVLYFKCGTTPSIDKVLNGLTACAAGMAFSLGIKFATKHSADKIFMVFGIMAFCAVGVFRLNMLLVIVLLGPPAVLMYWNEKRKREKNPAAKPEHLDGN
jgi:chromate transporter